MVTMLVKISPNTHSETHLINLKTCKELPHIVFPNYATELTPVMSFEVHVVVTILSEFFDNDCMISVPACSCQAASPSRNWRR